MNEKEEMIDKILKAKERKDKRIQEKIENEHKEKERLVAEIKKLAPRIEKLLDYGRTLHRCGFLDTCDLHMNYPEYFLANRDNHRVGFNIPNDFIKLDSDIVIRYIGIDFSGYDGDINLWVNDNGETILTNNNNDKHRTMDDIKLWMLKKFVAEFDDFETRVVNYINKL